MSERVLGTIINTAAILAGGTAGLLFHRQISPGNQLRLKYLLGAFTVYAGFRTTWAGMSGPFGHFMKEIGVVLLALVLGNVVGKLLRIQRFLNAAGSYARTVLSREGEGSGNRFADGFVTCTLLFCVGPMAILGALQDGLSKDIRILAIKSVMDGLATMAFSKTFGWSVMLAAVPVLAYQGTISLLAARVAPVLENHAMLDSINATGGLLIVSIALIIFEVGKPPLADYLPALIIAPLLAHWWL